MKPYSCEPTTHFPANPHPSPRRNTSLCFKRRLVSFFQKIPRNKNHPPVSWKKNARMPALMPGSCNFANFRNNEELFSSQITSMQKLYEALKKKANPFLAGHQQNASVCKNLRFERGHVGILFLSFHPQTDGFWDPPFRQFCKGTFHSRGSRGANGHFGFNSLSKSLWVDFGDFGGHDSNHFRIFGH